VSRLNGELVPSTISHEDLRQSLEGGAQAGSSLASRLRALSGHVSRRMRRALHLAVQKALGVVGSHYQVDFEAVVSVRNVVPTLTSSKRQGLSLNGRC
jgi:hypothetical protein